MLRTPTLLLLAAALALSACAPRIQRSSEPTILADEDEREANREALEELVARSPEAPHPAAQPDVVSASNSLPVLPVTVVEPPEAPAERGEGRISRSELRTFVEQGPHSLFRAVELEPVLNGERFQGFRVVSLAPEPAALRESGLRIGDVVTAVNGTDISNPDGFMRVWEGLAEADELTVEIVRAGDPRTLEWAIR